MTRRRCALIAMRFAVKMKVKRSYLRHRDLFRGSGVKAFGDAATMSLDRAQVCGQIEARVKLLEAPWLRFADVE